MKNHEYALVGGFNRAKLGRYVHLVSASVSAGIVFLLLTAVDLAQRFGINANIPPAVLSLAGAATVFAILYWIFDRFAWRWPLFNLALRVPNLSGNWNCDGQTINADGSPGYGWNAVITISQTWDKIRVRLETGQSTSHSISAALVCDDAEGYRLLYNYRNDPRIGEMDLASHLGFCEFAFSKDLKSAEGEYFNGRGRYTFGKMHLTRS